MKEELGLMRHTSPDLYFDQAGGSGNGGYGGSGAYSLNTLSAGAPGSYGFRWGS